MSSGESCFRIGKGGFAIGRRWALPVAALLLAASAAPAAAAENVPDGDQASYTTSGSLEQAIPGLATGDVCTVGLWVGKRSDGAGTWGRWYVQLTTGGWNIQNVMSGSLAAQTEEWAQYTSAPFTVWRFSSPPIRLRLKGQWGFEVYDLVELDCGDGNLVTDNSFESPAVPDGTWTTFSNPPPDGWTTVGGGAGVFNPNTVQMNDFFSCQPSAEICDGLDNDCNGEIDEGGDALCDNGEFCDGEETCEAGSCEPGTPPCDDGVGCTEDACFEDADSCDNSPDHASCDNGLFCDGSEICDASLDCQAGFDPCAADETCDEISDSCVPPAPMCSPVGPNGVACADCDPHPECPCTDPYRKFGNCCFPAPAGDPWSQEDDLCLCYTLLFINRSCS